MHDQEHLSLVKGLEIEGMKLSDEQIGEGFRESMKQVKEYRKVMARITHAQDNSGATKPEKK